MNTSNVIAILSILASVIIAIYSLWLNKKSSSHKFTYELLLKLFEDDDIRTAFNRIDYDSEKWYSEKFHSSNSREQREVDKLLETLNYIVVLHDQKEICASTKNS